MKSTFRTMAIAACFALVSLTSCYFPGSDQYKIKSATKEYVKSQLGEGEKFRYGYLERKCGRNVDGKFCKYAEVHYEVISASGETSEKMLFLLMSEHCDSVLDISEERNSFVRRDKGNHRVSFKRQTLNTGIYEKDSCYSYRMPVG